MQISTCYSMLDDILYPLYPLSIYYLVYTLYACCIIQKFHSVDIKMNAVEQHIHLFYTLWSEHESLVLSITCGLLCHNYNMVTLLWCMSKFNTLCNLACQNVTNASVLAMYSSWQSSEGVKYSFIIKYNTSYIRQAQTT